MSERPETQHDYDGIEELDNDLPRWWLGIFWVSIIFAIFYVPYYHIMNPDKLPAAAYEKATAAAEEDATEAATDNASTAAAETESSLQAEMAAGDWKEAGSKVFVTYCVACHAADGGGGIGPNMTDDYYIHGGTLTDIIRTVRQGVPEKGMIPWQGTLKPDDLKAAAFYMRSLRGTTAANPIDPQGSPVDEDGRFIEQDDSDPVDRSSDDEDDENDEDEDD